VNEKENHDDKKHQKKHRSKSTIDHAPRARVYAAWTDPEQLKQWWDRKECGHAISPPTQSWRQISLDLFNQEGEEMTVFGEYRELIPGKKIVFTWNGMTTRLGKIQAALSRSNYPIAMAAPKWFETRAIAERESRDRHNEAGVACSIVWKSSSTNNCRFLTAEEE